MRPRAVPIRGVVAVERCRRSKTKIGDRTTAVINQAGINQAEIGAAAAMVVVTVVVVTAAAIGVDRKKGGATAPPS